jgi:hypothetical protein
LPERLRDLHAADRIAHNPQAVAAAKQLKNDILCFWKDLPPARGIAVGWGTAISLTCAAGKSGLHYPELRSPAPQCLTGPAYIGLCRPARGR